MVRRDVDVEVDCAQSRTRMPGGRSYGHTGPLPEQEPAPAPDDWETVSADSWPVLQMLHAIACQPIDLTGQGQPLAQAEERIRSRINDY